MQSHETRVERLTGARRRFGALERIPQWIEQGAAWPEDVVLKERRADQGPWWSLQPIVKARKRIVDGPTENIRYYFSSMEKVLQG